MIRAGLLRFHRDESGSALVEFAIVSGLFFFLLFGLIDFARLGFNHVMANKATEMAVRLAVVRAPACSGVPELTQRKLIASTVPNGTACTAASAPCVAAAAVQCTGSASDPTASAIWNRIADLMPPTATMANLRFAYTYDAALNRVGAPYVPVVTVAITDLDFDFISPLGALAALAGGTGETGLGDSFAVPSMSASLPAEDLR